MTVFYQLPSSVKKHLARPIFYFLLASIPFEISAQLNVSLNRADHLYETGETAQFTVSSNLSGLVSYEIGYDQLTQPIATGTVNVSPGQAAQIPYTASQPGTVFLWATQNGSTAVAQAAFSPYKIQPSEPEPSDFDAFWNTQKTLLQQVAINPILTFHSSSGRSTTYEMSLGFIDGRRVYGYISIPNASGRFPAVIHFPPFGQNAGLVHPLNYLTDELGIIAVALTIHNAPADQTDPNAYLPNDPTDKNNIYYRYAILTGLRTIEYLHTRPDFDGQNIVMSGESQGGGLSLMVAGLDPRVDLVVGSITALSEHGAYKYGKATGFPNYLHTAFISTYGNQTHVNNTLAAVKYYDAQYFAKRYTGPCLTAICYKDEISPAATIFTAINQTGGRHEIIHALTLGHNHPEEYWVSRTDAIRRYFPATRTPANNPTPPSGLGHYANAGADQNINLTQAATLTGTVDFNGSTNTSFPVVWDVLSGPGNVVFSNKNARTTNATFSASGTYVLRFTATNSALLSSKQRYFTCSDLVKITVGGAPPPPPPVCNPMGTEPWWQWIASVSFSNVLKISGKTQFSDFTSSVVNVEKGSSYPITLTPGFSWQIFDENWRVWIDWNDDDDFSDPGEMVFENIDNSAVSGSISVPSAVATGQVKMRIAMKNGGYPDPCEVFQYGEVEDYTVNIINPLPPACSISGQATNVQCLDNGTPYDGSDDRWSFDLTMNAANTTSTNWRTTINGTTHTGQYGVAKTIGNQPFTGTLAVTVTDALDANCRFTLNVNPPQPCVQTPPAQCAITGQTTNVECLDNGTPFDGSDDRWNFDLTMNAVNTTSTSWRTTINGTTHTGQYGVAKTIGNQLFTGTLSVMVMDALDANCRFTLSVAPPQPCVQTPPDPCSITGSAGNLRCLDNGTPFDGTDDRWSFDLTMTATNTSSTSWRTTINGTTHTGQYGVAKTIGNQPFAGTLSVSVMDVLDANCRFSLNVNPPQPCVQTPPATCSISGSTSNLRCLDNGTPYDGSDDRWSFDLTLNAQNSTATTWFSTVNGSNVTGQYGVPRTIGNLTFPNSVALTATDAANSTCQFSITVSPPQPCVQTQPPGSGYCTLKSNYPWHEWISKVQFGNTSFLSGKSQYSNFTANEIPMGIGRTISMRLTVTYSWMTYNENWRVWIDYNRNGIFENSELVRLGNTFAPQANANAQAEFISNFNVPSNVAPGRTRMRIIMSRNSIVSPCNDIANGEIEDYTVVLSNNLAAPDDREIELLDFQANKNAGGVDLPYLLRFNTPILEAVFEKSFDGKNFQPLGDAFLPASFAGTERDENPQPGDNFYRLRITFDNGQVIYSEVQQVNFDFEISQGIFPNPARSSAWLDVSAYAGLPLQIQLVDIFGKPVFGKSISEVAEKRTLLDLSGIGSGAYFVVMQSPGLRRATTQKLIVEKGF